jgi:hypothetical protein
MRDEWRVVDSKAGSTADSMDPIEGCDDGATLRWSDV